MLYYLGMHAVLKRYTILLKIEIQQRPLSITYIYNGRKAGTFAHQRLMMQRTCLYGCGEERFPTKGLTGNTARQASG